MLTLSGNEETCCQWIDRNRQRSVWQNLSVGLDGHPRHRFDSEIATRFVEETSIGPEILSHHAPQNPQRVPQILRREYAGVEETVIARDSIAEGNEIVENRTKVGNEDG